MAWPTNPRPAKCLLVLRDQIDARWPNRAKGNDGVLGDERHQATKSDHNPTAAGVVLAIDITKDLTVGLDSRAVAQALLDSRDPRIKYIISNGQICSSKVSPWIWRPYSGADDHSHHFHLSVDADPAQYDDTRPWKFGASSSPPVHPPIVPLAHSGKGSWYSQFDGKYKWVDTGDAPGSAALGVPDDAQGVSFYDHTTLGKWFQVRAPNGVTSLEQQTDIGPSPSTGRLIDISAAAAERFGYSPKTFPTDGIFSWQQVAPPAAVAGLSPQQAAVKIRDTSSPPPVLPPAPIPTPPPQPKTEPTMNLFKFLPLLMRLLQILPSIQEAARSGTSIIAILQKFAPDLIGILGSVGADLFPSLAQDSQIKVGALMMDPVKIRGIQNRLNALGVNPPLEADGLYGQKTKDAVTAFQTAHNIVPADGWAGDITSAAIQTEFNKLTPAAAPSQVGTTLPFATT